jgi:hypothetical protein
MKASRDMGTVKSILCGLFFAGHESCRLFSTGTEWRLEGTAVFNYEQQPCRLDYQIVCDEAWHTLSAHVESWLDTTSIDLQIRTDPGRRWWLNDAGQPDVMGCIDIDLNFSPSTNLLPIRRLGLAVGESGEVNAAWLRFPSFKLERLPQQYHHLDENTYRYESAGGQFVAELKVDASGFVVDYPNLWQAEASSE